SSKLTNSLPGYLHLFIGMEIVLKHRNLYIELGILNGAKGILRKLEIEVDDNGHSFCKAALVEFPNSNIHLKDLPPHYFPIEAQSWKSPMYIINDNNEHILITLHRSQLPFEPAFSMTGQSAQGYGFDSIVCSLHNGGFQAYVAASRAKTRRSLFITR
ncbi:hypothetical protein FB446DRAFT_617285, partial [Lentinula raphanica]